MTTLYLIRHGQTDWNVEGRWQGQADVPLNTKGKKQAITIARQISHIPINAIYSSDLIRATATASEISYLTKIKYEEDVRLREIHQGEWQGLLVSEIEERFSGILNQRRDDPLHIAPPGGEMVITVRDRVTEAVAEIVSRHPQDSVAVVSHGFALAVIQIHYLHRPISNVWDFVPENDEWRILKISQNNPIS